MCSEQSGLEGEGRKGGSREGGVLDTMEKLLGGGRGVTEGVGGGAEGPLGPWRGRLGCRGAELPRSWVRPGGLPALRPIV